MKRNFNSQYFFSIVWRVTMVLMIVFHTGVASIQAAPTDAFLSTTNNLRLWKTVTYEGNLFEIWLVLKPGGEIPSSSAPLLSDLHYTSIESIYIMRDGDRLDDPSLEFEILFLAQNELLLRDQTTRASWVENLSSQQDGELIYIYENSSIIPLFVPIGINPNNGTKNDVITVLSVFNKRVYLYEQLIRKITHPGLEIDGVYEIEGIFDDEMGWIYKYALWYANNSEIDKLSEPLEWLKTFVVGIDLGTELYIVNKGFQGIPNSLKNIQFMADGLVECLNSVELILDVAGILDHQLDALSRYIATIIYIQSSGYQRLDAFEWAVANYPHSDRDPALLVAIQNINNEYESFLSVENVAGLVWAPFFTEIFRNYHPDAIDAFIDVAGIIGGILWTSVIPQPFGIAIGAAWTSAILLTEYFIWAERTPEIIAHSGLALELESIMEEALIFGFSSWSPNSDLSNIRPLLLTINQRIFSGYLFYKILIQRYKTNDDLYIHKWFVQEEAPYAPLIKLETKLTNFAFSLPLAYIETQKPWVGVKARGPAIFDILPVNITDFQIGDTMPIRVQFIANTFIEKVECKYVDLSGSGQQDWISIDTSSENGWGCDWVTTGFSASIYGISVKVTDIHGNFKWISTAVRLLGLQLPIISRVIVTPNKTQYDPGETVILNVSLEDNDNLRITGASLSYSINDTTRSCNETGISCSDLGNGNYTISFPAPSAIRDYMVEVTTSKPGYVSGTGATTITVYAPFELGHDADLYFFIAEKAASQVRAQANVRNNGTYAGTDSETIRIVYRLKDPSGGIVATDSSQVFTLAKNAVGYSIGIYLNDPGGFKDGQYIVEAEAEIVGKTDQNPANNKQSVSLWYGDRPTYNEYGLHQASAAAGAITSPVIDGYTLQVVSINTTYKYAYINVFNNGSSVSDCQLERAYLGEILTCDNNNLAIVLNVITSGGSSAWFYLGKANNTGVTFTPGTAVTPAGLDAAFRVTGPVGVDLREFNVEYAGVDDDFSIVSAWKLTTRRNQPNDWNVSLRVPSATTPRTYNFWMAFNDNNSSFNRIIKKLAVEVQAPHNIVIPSITPNNQNLTVGAVVPISVTVQNSGGYTEYGLNALLTITGPNGYIQTFNNPITSLSSGSSTNRTINWSTGGLSAGTYTIKGEVPLSLDAYPADNTRTVTNTLSTPPALFANASTNKNNYQQNESISLSANVTANNSAVSGATVTYFMKDSSHQTVSSGQLADQENGFYSLNLSAPLSVDLYSITVTATKSGYINGTAQLTEISVTKAPPETTLLTASPSDGDLINYNDLGFEWIGTDLSVPSNLLEYSYKLDSNPWSSFSPSTSVFFSDMAEGLHTFYVKTRTTNGLEDLTPASRSFTVDTQAPIFEIPPAPDAAIYSNTDTIRVQIDLDGPATVNASFNTIDSHFSPHNIVVLETNASTHRYSISYPISANNTNSDNSYSINIYALDAAGNTRTASLSVRLDNYPPTILAKNPDDGEEAITGTAISVLFSEPMNKAATESAFSIQPSLTGSFAWMGNQLIFAPGASLQCETDYLIQLSPSAIDFAGKPISLTSWQFSTGSCSYPEIDLRWQDNNASIPSGDSMPSVSNGTDFGNVNIINSTLSRTYQIFNLGNASLFLTGNPSVGISGTNAADFAISQPVSSHVAPGSSTSFTVVFNPSQVGTRLATLSIPNNDPNENPYTFKIQGTGISTSPPGDFAKTAPATGSTNQPDSLTLNWQTSSYATRYEYCYDTTNDNACSTWIDVGDSTSTGIGGLDYDSTYYWQVRAWNGAIGPIYANQGVFWSFTTQEQPSNLVFADDFSAVKAWLDESNGNIFRDSTNEWLAWTVTRAQTRRFYALTDVPSNDVDMSFRFQLSSVLGNGSIYFGLAEDLDGSLHNPTFPTGFFLMVGTYAQLKIVYPHITYADDYPNSWNPDDTSTYLNFGSLGLWRQCDVVIKDGQWRVQLLDENGGLLDEISGTLPKAHSRYNYFMIFLDEVGGWETTSGLFDDLYIRIQPPGAFDKSNPLPEATGVSTSPILSWSPSSGVNNYEYCLDTTDDNACSNWIRTAGTTAKLSGLSANTSYYWQVRASNPGGITYANGSSTTYWSFTTQPVQQQPPGAFNKRDPFDLASGVPVSLLLRWDSSSGAERYEYCYDATDDQACSNWIDVGTNTSVSVGPLKYSTHYTWQVRATNSAGVTYADDSQSASWSFITRQIDSPITPGGNKIYLPFLS